MSIFNLFKLSYWFHQPFIAYGWSLRGWVILLLILILAGIVIKISQLKQSEKILKQIYNRLANVCFVVGLLGLLWLFLRQETVPFFAWRFWLIFLFGWLLWSIIRTVVYLIKRLPEIKAEQAAKEQKEKYLPKSR